MNTLNGNYVNAVKAVKILDSKAGSLFKNIGLFVVDVAYGNGLPATGTDIKPVFKAQEMMASVEHKVAMGENSTYRVVKNLLVNCVAKGVSIVDANGKLKGKTELEKELALLKEEKSAIEKFKATMGTAEKIAAQLDARDIPNALAMIKSLMDSVPAGLKLAA
jgi:hypothetical protein